MIGWGSLLQLQLWDLSLRSSEYLKASLPVDILAELVNLEICETVGFDGCLIEVLQIRASVN